MDITSLIYKVHCGDATSDERKDLVTWISASQANKAEYEDVVLLWQMCSEENSGHTANFYEGIDLIRKLVKF